MERFFHRNSHQRAVSLGNLNLHLNRSATGASSQRTLTNSLPGPIVTAHDVFPVAAGAIENAEFYKQRLSETQIRLLRIEPGALDDALDCTLVPVELDRAPAYLALSYCWGRREPSASLTLNGRPGFKLTKHLRAALVRLRDEEEEQYAWVDAICIKQADIRERNQQVARMRKIFNRAERVVVWLGEIDPKKPTCKCYLPDGATDSTQKVCAEERLSAQEHGNVHKVIQGKLITDESWSRQDDHEGQVWWKRLWVLQEFAVARSVPTVCVGPHTISWKFFSSLLWSKGDKHLFQTLRKTDHHSLLQLLRDTSSDFYCWDDRDRIFALMGLVNDDDAIRPDYAMTVAEAYEEATLYLIRKEGTLDVLLDYRSNREFKECDGTGELWDLPSWIPNFSLICNPREIKTPDDFRAGYDDPDVSIVASPTMPMLCHCRTPMALRIKAIPFDTISSKVDMHKLAKTSTTLLRKTLLQELNVKFDDLPPHPLPRAPNLGFLMLDYIFAGTASIFDTRERCRDEMSLFGGGVNGLRYVPKHAYSEQLGREFGFANNRGGLSEEINLDMAVAMTFSDVFGKRLKSSGSEREFKTKLGSYTAPRRLQSRAFFATESGFTGTGPASLQPHDKIIVPFGSKRPLIVRMHGDHYVLVGDCVIPGIMSGRLSALHQQNDDIAQAADFLIK